MKVYLLQHSYKYELDEDMKIANTKSIGIYSSRQKAEEVIEQYIVKQGFRRFPKKCFLISEYVLDESYWIEGFVTLKKAKGGQWHDIPKKLKSERTLKESDKRVEIENLEEIYFFQHCYEYEIDGLDFKLDSTNKVIGIYSSEEKAESVKEQVMVKPGFNRHPDDCFYIDRYRLNEDHWTEGFITWDSETDSWIE